MVSSLRRMCRSWRWLLLAACLLGVGWCIDATVTPPPRWTIEGPLSVQHWTPDGRTLVAIGDNRGPQGEYFGPVTIWNVADGQRLATFFTADDRFSDYRQTEDGTHLFYRRDDGKDGRAIFSHVDAATAHVTEHAIGGIAAIGDWVITPQADLLAIADTVDGKRAELSERRLTIVDLASDAVVARMPLPDWDSPLLCTSQFLIFATLTGKQASTVLWNTRTRKQETVLPSCGLSSYQPNLNQPDTPLLLMGKDTGHESPSMGVWDLRRRRWSLQDVRHDDILAPVSRVTIASCSCPTATATTPSRTFGTWPRTR